MSFESLKLAFAITGSFCTFSKVFPEIEKLAGLGIDITPIMSERAVSTDTRFGRAEDFKKRFEEICGKKVLCSIKDVEPLGPKKMVDALIIAPCTGNTMSKIANGITDTAVSMAVKSNLRNQNPVIIAVSTNDALSANAKNLGLLLNTKNIYFVPFGQDDPTNKQASLVADMTKIPETLEKALMGQQLQPIIIKSG